jgi:hypothetical protein
MKERLVLVRTTGYRTVFLVMGVLAVGLLVTWVIGTLVGGAGPGNLNSVVAPLLIGTVAAAFFFFLSVATFYTVLELEDTDLIFTGIFGRTATFPIALLDRVGVGRGSYSFAFKPPENVWRSSTPT